MKRILFIIIALLLTLSNPLYSQKFVSSAKAKATVSVSVEIINNSIQVYHSNHSYNNLVLNPGTSVFLGEKFSTDITIISGNNNIVVTYNSNTNSIGKESIDIDKINWNIKDPITNVFHKINFLEGVLMYVKSKGLLSMKYFADNIDVSKNVNQKFYSLPITLNIECVDF